MHLAFFLPEWAALRNISWKIRGDVTPTFPMWILIQEHFSIHLPLNLTDAQVLPPHLLLGGKGLLSFIPIPQLQQTMITKGNNGNITLFRINNTTNVTTLDFWLCPRLSNPWGTTLHTLYFTPTFNHAPIVGQDRSWDLTHLLYSTLRVSCHFCLTIKIILLQLKIPTSLTFCCVCALFSGLPHVLPLQPHFKLRHVKTHYDHTWSLLWILPYLTNQGEPLCWFLCLYAW